MKTISAVIPCYNHGKTIHQAVQSILKQTVRVDEIIIVDDGSTDKHTIETLKNIHFDRTRVIFTENSGPSAARNRGIADTTGEYIILCDADDYYSNTFIEKAVETFEKNKNIAGVTCYQKLFGKNRGVRKTTGGEIKDFLAYNRAGINCIIRKDIWQEVGGFDETMKEGYEDWEFWIRITKKGYRIAAVPEALYNYRIHKISHNKSAHKKHIQIYNYIINKHIDCYREHIAFIIEEKEKEIQKLRSFWVYSLGFKIYNRFRNIFNFFKFQTK